MDDDTPSPARPTSRRGLLTGLAAGAAGALAAEVLRPGVAGAADGQPVVLGRDNQADNSTTITMSTANAGLKAVTNADDGSLVGENTAADGYGLRGSGVYIGVNAVGGSIGTYTVSDYGVALDALTYDGVAVKGSVAVPSLGYALETNGRVKFSSAGRIAVAAGQAKVVLSGLALSPSSLVLATLQTRKKGLFVEAAVPDLASSSATVYLNKPAPTAVELGWFVIG
ncbi:MAG: hypothetical protein ABWZ55_12210 [Acidimicrobiales bacterium]